MASSSFTPSKFSLSLSPSSSSSSYSVKSFSPRFASLPFHSSNPPRISSSASSPPKSLIVSSSQNRRRPLYIPNHILDAKYVRVRVFGTTPGEQSPGATLTSKEYDDGSCTRSDREFLHEILGEVIKAGATTLNIPHTVGITMPSELGQLIADIMVNNPGIENIIISTHCQNDLGLSTANTIAGACAGARQVEVTINGIGTRAGNASMEEVVVALKHRGGLYTRINTQHIVGANAFAHESGLHQDGMLKHKGTYEIMSPEVIRLERSNEAGIVLGKLSGHHALRDRLIELGYELDDVQLKNIFWRFKGVAEQKKRVTDADLIALVLDEVFQPEFVWKHLDQLVTCGTLGLSTATVKLIDADLREHVAGSVGTRPIDSTYKAVDLIIKVQCQKSVLYTGLHVLPHKAIVGANAFAHGSGIHQDGMLKYKVTYEMISLRNMGLERSSEAGNVLGKLSGRHALGDQVKELVYEVDDVLLENTSRSIKEVADQKKRVTEADPIALVSDEVFQPLTKWDVLGTQVTCGTVGGSTAAVKVIDAGDGREHFTCSIGIAPVDSAFEVHVRCQRYVPFLVPLVWVFGTLSLNVLDWLKKRE
ncbi:hypothetical protein V6N13_093265 [Hibiscus sabdariffa]